MSNKFDPKKPSEGHFTDHNQELYRSVEAVANSDLLLVERNPSDVIWSREAPSDPTKTAAKDYGTAVHTGLLEPELFDKSVLVFGATKTRNTKAFEEFEAENKGKIVLLESEYDQLRLTVASAKAHPSVNRFLFELESVREGSIYVKDKERDIMRKIRPDNNFLPGVPLIGDVKTTSDIGAWRENVRWRNPLFTLNYGHGAAFYLDTASLHYGENIDEYLYLLISKSAELGRYAVAPITITREELEQYGFFDRMRNNLDKYAECYHSGNWFGVERFPRFN